jgi:hypothetical protein
MRGEREGQAECRRDLGAERARAEDPHRHAQPGAGHRPHALPRLRLAQQGQDLQHVVGKLVGIGMQGAPQRRGRRRVGPRCASQSQIDPPREQRFERAELLGHLQRRVVGQHDAAGADADARRAAADVRQEHRRRRTGDARHVVVLGQPEAGVAPALDVSRQIQRVAERIGGRAPFDDRRKVQNGQRGGHDGRTSYSRNSVPVAA